MPRRSPAPAAVGGPQIAVAAAVQQQAARGRLRIAQLAPPSVPVPPLRYGGTELVVSLLTEELVRRGHEVTLFASGDSRTAARLAPTVDVAVWRQPRPADLLAFVMKSVDMALSRADEFDIIHNHLGFAAMPAARVAAPGKLLTTVHGRLDLPDQREGFCYFREAPVVSISDAQRQPVPWANWLGTVYHGIDVDAFTFQPRHQGYAAFLGRIAPEKGLETAIDVARQAGLPIKIAARLPLNQPDNTEAQRDWQYYREVIEPLFALPQVEYVGEAAPVDKAEFLGNAAVLLFPIRWPEPFGLVMVEALACGTPVVAIGRGSVPEVIEDGVTGFVVPAQEDMAAALRRLDEIDRARCRRAAELRFSVAVMTDAYERLYRQMMESREVGRDAIAGASGG